MIKPHEEIYDCRPVTDFSKYWEELCQCSVKENKHDDFHWHMLELMIIEAKSMPFLECDINTFQAPFEGTMYSLLNPVQQEKWGCFNCNELKGRVCPSEDLAKSKVLQVGHTSLGGLENLLK